MAENGTTGRGVWRRNPWNIVLIIILIICFSVQRAVGAPALTSIGTGLMLVGWTAQLMINLRHTRRQ